MYLNPMGETSEIDISKVYTTMLDLKFSSIPHNDSIQFRITGRISDEGYFEAITKLVVLDLSKPALRQKV